MYHWRLISSENWAWRLNWASCVVLPVHFSCQPDHMLTSRGGGQQQQAPAAPRRLCAHAAVMALPASAAARFVAAGGSIFHFRVYSLPIRNGACDTDPQESAWD